jgi:hypothetical protein
MRTIQYLPGFGRELYWHTGRGAEQEKKHAREKAEGKSRPSLFESIVETFNPADLKTSRQN